MVVRIEADTEKKIMPNKNGNLAYCRCGKLLRIDEGPECDICFEIRLQQRKEHGKLEKLRKEKEKSNV